MKRKLIIVDGQSTVGKSTTSKSVYEQIRGQAGCFWLHEECERHPIRFGEFEAGDVHTAEGMEANRRDMLSKWVRFAGQIVESNQICVTEGCLLHAIDRYLLTSVWDMDEILHYFSQIEQILRPLDPLIVFLYRPDIRTSFEKAFAQRGDWWRELILRRPEPYGYFADHEYTGDDSVFASVTMEQSTMSEVFDALECDKLKIDTTDERWDDYVRAIVETVGFSYALREDPPAQAERYCGTYQLQGGEDIWKIDYDEQSQQLYTSLFWPYMSMRYIGGDRFELISFPVRLDFDFSAGVPLFSIEGNYDWDYNGRTFVKMGI